MGNHTIDCPKCGEDLRLMGLVEGLNHERDCGAKTQELKPEEGKWNLQHGPEQVEIWDIFISNSGERFQIAEIRRTSKHGQRGYTYEFIDREGVNRPFSSFNWKYDEGI